MSLAPALLALLPCAHLSLTLSLQPLAKIVPRSHRLWRRIIAPVAGLYDIQTVLIALAALTVILVGATEITIAAFAATPSMILIPVAALSGIGYYTTTLLLTNISTPSFLLTRRPQSTVALSWCAAVAAAEEIIWRVVPFSLVFMSGAHDPVRIGVYIIATCAFAYLHNPSTATKRDRAKILTSMAGFALIAFVLMTTAGALVAIAFHIAYNITQARLTAGAGQQSVSK